jgi:Fic family protein
VEGVVEMVLDATAHCDAAVTADRLFGWHAALFPTGFSGMSRLRVGDWRDDTNGAMQMVSGAIGRQRVHFEAPPADRLDTETSRLLPGSTAIAASRRSSRQAWPICGS